jgi:hypothetical protein
MKFIGLAVRSCGVVVVGVVVEGVVVDVSVTKKSLHQNVKKSKKSQHMKKHTKHVKNQHMLKIVDLPRMLRRLPDPPWPVGRER